MTDSLDGSLIGSAVQRAAELLAVEVRLGEVAVRLNDRAVFAAAADEFPPLVIKADTVQRRHMREVSVYQSMREADLEAAQVIAADHGDGLAILVMARLSGGPLTSWSSPSLWSDAGAFLNRFHGLRPPGKVGPFDPDDEDWVAFVRRWGAEAIDRFARTRLLDTDSLSAVAKVVESHVALVGEPSDRVLLHGDSQPDHFFFDDTRLTGVIDLADARIGDLAWDLAVLTESHPERLDDVLDGYGAVGNGRAELEAHASAYRVLRILGATAWRFENGIDVTGDLERVRALAHAAM